MVAIPILLCLLSASCSSSRQGRLAHDDVSGWLDRGRAAAAENRHLDAAGAFEKVLEVDYSSLDAHRGLILAHLNLGRLKALEQLYRERRASDPMNPFHSYGLAITLYATSTGLADKALSLLSEAREHRPDLSDIPYRKGVILLDAERYAEARQAFEKALAIEDLARYRAPLALSLYHLGKPEQSLEVLRGLLHLDPSPNEVEMARQVAERISDPFRGFPEAARGKLTRAIDWLERADVPQNALDLLREILLEHPEAAMVHAVLGLAYQRIDAGGEAFIHLQHAVELAPHLAITHLYLANLLASRERYEDARDSYLAALERNPLLLEAHAALGNAAAERGDTKEATRHLRAWSLLDPRRTQPRLLLARTLAAAGDLDATERELKGVLELEEDNLEAHLSLGAVYVRRHSETPGPELREAYARMAKEHLDRVLAVQPDNPAARRLVAEIR